MNYLITPSLLNSWQYYLNCREGYEDSAKESFINTLKRIKAPTTEAQQKGIDFENYVKLATEGKKGFITTENQQYADCIQEIADIVEGGAWQVKVYKDMIIDNFNFFLYGKVDVLKGNYAYDIKYTGNYKEAGKFFDSYQHPFYLECLDVPHFAYLISDGKNVWREDYHKSELYPIENSIRDFIQWMPKEFAEIYFDKWKSLDV
jgi:hypothetical protein